MGETEKIKFTPIFKKYQIHCHQIIPIDKDEWMLQTDKGTKMMRVFDDLEKIMWSHQWREQMTRQGFRTLERFIRTKDGEPYAQLHGKKIVVTDGLEGESFQIKDEQTCFFLGEITARIHLAMELVKRFQYTNQPFLARNHFYENWRKQTCGWEPLLDRVDTAVEYMKKGDSSWNGIHPFHPNQIIKMGDYWYLKTGLKEIWEWAPAGLSRLLTFLRDLNLENFDPVTSFLKGYGSIRSLSSKEIYSLIGYLIFPTELMNWEIKGGFHEKKWFPEQLVHQQKKREELAKKVFAVWEEGM
ncbi:hypothetical protein L1765_01565 [Microaerobacter geothermalis]|uniref:hypothetical protein n=1 Tax=Microaerobacter geothermalis TaxID=674972 RepID=UPI001F2854B8|nr:hypothetical protein [Microaerobacter geothermalis]MCF6092680.1 hypothetical protein [Microaerobacter geothermalis]